MRVYEVFNMMDMALSDEWFPTKAAAMKAIRSYGVRGPGTPDENNSRNRYWESENDGAVYLCPYDIEPTKAGICWALKNLPNR